MSVFDSYKEKVEQAAKSNPNLLITFADDLYINDKDIIENDAKGGDKYLGIIKSSGAGTEMIRLGNSSKDDSFNLAEYHIKENQEGVFFLLDFKGIDDGVVTSISASEAAELARSVKTNPDRKPRRERLQSKLGLLLGVDISYGLLHSKLKSREGDIIALKVSGKSAGYKFSGLVSFARTKLSKEHDNEEPVPTHGEFETEVSISKFNDLSDQPKYFKATIGYKDYAELSEITEKTFKNTLKKIEAKEKSAFEIAI